MLMDENHQIKVNEKEANLIKIMRKTEFGEMKIIIQDGTPVRIEEIKKSIKL